jgi:hypothetical protein
VLIHDDGTVEKVGPRRVVAPDVRRVGVAAPRRVVAPGERRVGVAAPRLVAPGGPQIGAAA